MNVVPWSTIGQGTQSSAVRAIQYLLIAHGASVVVDGDYGPATAAAVSAFQADRGLAVDGVVGPQTWTPLIVATGPGSHGDAVRAVQQFGLLRSPGDTPLVVDGDYGTLTASHVEAFQNGWGLSRDGAAGTETWSFLSTITPGPRPWPLVEQGATQATNHRVLPAQHLLRAHGATIAADGVFGPKSGAAILAFQQTLRATYISTTVGQLDWPFLIVTVKAGDTGDAVRAVQVLVGVSVDGQFGPKTAQAVKEFQNVFLPPADGIVGPQTWQSLLGPLFD